MEFIFPRSSSQRILVVADADVASVNRLASTLIAEDPVFDMVLVLGPLTHKECATEEEIGVAKANIAAIIAQFETIVCRVVYLGSDNDPTDVLTDQLFLTPNSVNIHLRYLPLCEGFFVCGFAETKGNLDTHGVVEEEEEIEGLTLSSNSAVAIISDVLNEATSRHGYNPIENDPISVPDEHEDQPSMEQLGIFALNYKYSHTLNHFLFHQPESLDKAGVKVAVIGPPCPSLNTTNDTDESNYTAPKLPNTFGNLTIVAPGSLRNDKNYSVLTVRQASGDKKEWVVDGVETCSVGV